MTTYTHIRDFIEVHCVQKGYSPNTVSSYATALHQLLAFAATHQGRPVHSLDFSHFDSALFLAYLDDLEAQGNSIATRNQRLSALRTVFVYLGAQHCSFLVPAASVAQMSKKRGSVPPAPKHLSEAELKAIIEAAAAQSKPLQRARDTMLVHLMHNTGARASELVGIDLRDIRNRASEATVDLLGKGNKSRTIALWPETVVAIDDYLAERTCRGIVHEALILSPQRQRLTRFGLRKVVRRLCKAAGAAEPGLTAKVISPHTFRHSTAFHLLRTTKNLVLTQHWLGHAHIDTTSYYARVDVQTQREAFETFRAPGVDVPSAAWKEPDIMQYLESLIQSPSASGALCAQTTGSHLPAKKVQTPKGT